MNTTPGEEIGQFSKLTFCPIEQAHSISYEIPISYFNFYNKTKWFANEASL